MTTNLILNYQDLEEFKNFVITNDDLIDIVAFDLETDSSEEIKAKVYGIGLAFQEDEAFYIPIRHKDGSFYFHDEAIVSIFNFLDSFLTKKKLIGHNIIYDTLVWKNNGGADISSSIHADTILMKHCLEENPPFALKEISVKYLGPWADKAQEALFANIAVNGGSTTKTNLQMFMADTKVLGEYCCWDVMLTFKLFNLFSMRLEKEGLLNFFYNEEVMPLYKEVTIRMKEKGIPVNIKYFEDLKAEVIKDLVRLEAEIMQSIEPLIYDYQLETLNLAHPVKQTGKFPKVYAGLIGLQLDSIAKKKIESIDPKTDLQINFKKWMLGGSETLEGPVIETQLRMFFEKHPDQNYVFNLRSKAQLKTLFFDILKCTPLSFTEGGDPQVDDDFLDSISKDFTWVKNLQDLNKLEKIKGTYVEGILERAVDGVIYASLLQFGTTSGRYASRNPNLQNLPRPKEDDSGLSELVLRYNNAIRAGFVAPEGYVFVDADYSALEPRAFSHMSGDPGLQMIFHSGVDMYSSIAQRVFKIEGVSANKKDKNYLGKLYPEKRQLVKAFCLAVAYGAEAFRIADLAGIDKEEAQQMIDDYLNAYPGLKKYIQQCHYETNTKGYVKTIFGRVRHLGEAKTIYNEYGNQLLNSRWAKSKGLSEVRRTYKNLLNNSTNFKIQGLAAHIVNRAMIAINRRFRDESIDGWVCMTIHDQIVCTVIKDKAEDAVRIVQDCMENIIKLDVPLVAEPKIAYNMRDSH